MNSKKLIKQSDYKYFPFNFRFMEIERIEDKEKSEKQLKFIEIKNIQSFDSAKFFYKPISRLQ